MQQQTRSIGIVLLALAAFCSPALAGLEWERTEVRKEAGPRATEAVASFGFTNTGEEPVTIEKVEPSCGCTTAKLDKKTYGSGECGEITATFAFGARTGRHVKTIAVTTDEERDATTHLKLTAVIPELLRVHPRFLRWGPGEKRKPKTIDLTVKHEEPHHTPARFAEGMPKGASYLYWLDDEPDAQAFEKYLADNPGAIDLWLGGHTHTNPDDRTGGRSHVARKWGVNFINCAALTRHHVRLSVPMSRLLTFTDGSDEVRVRCYLHTSQHAPQGWYEKAERRLKLNRAFRIDG